MFELVDSQPSHMVSVDAINLTPGEKTFFAKSFLEKKIPNISLFFVLTLTTQISQTQKGWSGSSTQKMKSLRSSPCEEPEDHDILFRFRYSLLLCIRKEYYLKNSSQSSCDGVVCLSDNVQDSLSESVQL